MSQTITPTPEAYLSRYPPPMQRLGHRVRALVKRTLPESTERVKLGWNSINLYVAGKQHPIFFCLGWSESVRLRGDDQSYLQKFTPRRKPGTTSERNRRHAARLVEEGWMTPAGLAGLGGDPTK